MFSRTRCCILRSDTEFVLRIIYIINNILFYRANVNVYGTHDVPIFNNNNNNNNSDNICTTSLQQQRRYIDFAISLFRDNNTPLIFRPIVNHIIIIHAKNASRKIQNFNDLCKLFFTQVYLWTSRRAPRFIGWHIHQRHVPLTVFC